MSVRQFFKAAETEAAPSLGESQHPAVVILDGALERGMLNWSGSHFPTFNLKRGEGAQARARLLVAASRLGLAPASMWPNETVGEWLGRGLRENLRHDQIVPLLRAAARAGKVNLKDLEARAP